MTRAEDSPEGTTLWWGDEGCAGLKTSEPGYPPLTTRKQQGQAVDGALGPIRNSFPPVSPRSCSALCSAERLYSRSVLPTGVRGSLATDEPQRCLSTVPRCQQAWRLSPSLTHRSLSSSLCFTGLCRASLSCLPSRRRSTEPIAQGKTATSGTSHVVSCP